MSAEKYHPLDELLVCYGCAHSAAGEGFPPPGRPSGERPCCFCVRNRERTAPGFLADHVCQTPVINCPHPMHGRWYDGSAAIKVPMDCYQTLDMQEQRQRWTREAPKLDEMIKLLESGDVLGALQLLRPDASVARLHKTPEGWTGRG